MAGFNFKTSVMIDGQNLIAFEESATHILHKHFLRFLSADLERLELDFFFFASDDEYEKPLILILAISWSLHLPVH